MSFFKKLGKRGMTIQTDNTHSARKEFCMMNTIQAVPLISPKHNTINGIHCLHLLLLLCLFIILFINFFLVYRVYSS